MPGCLVAKAKVAGSNPVFRSNHSEAWSMRVGRASCFGDTLPFLSLFEMIS
jgi:hypothetical protein